MQANSKIALRYARAIVDSLKDAKITQAVVDELRALAQTMASSKELELVLTSAIFSEQARQEVISDLVAKLKLSPQTHRILKVITEAKRMKFIAVIAESVHYLQLESTGIVPLKVQAAGDLNGDEKKKIETKFSKLLGKDVEASYEVDPTLIGGVKVTAAGRTYDGSVAGWLNTFEERLVGGSI